MCLSNKDIPQDGALAAVDNSITMDSGSTPMIRKDWQQHSYHQLQFPCPLPQHLWLKRHSTPHYPRGRQWNEVAVRTTGTLVARRTTKWWVSLTAATGRSSTAVDCATGRRIVLMGQMRRRSRAAAFCESIVSSVLPLNVI